MKTATSVRLRDAGDAALYEVDFFEWTQRTAERLRRQRFAEIDAEHVAQEIEDTGKRDLRELNSRMEVLLAHLLKWKLQPRKHSSSWRATIVTQRREILAILKDSPSLRLQLVAAEQSNYEGALERAAAETGLDMRKLAPSGPFSMEEIVNLRFLPD